MEILHIIPIGGTHIIPLANMLQRLDKENKHTFMVTTPFQTVVKYNVNLLQIRGLQFVPIFKGNSFKKKMRYMKNRIQEAGHVVWHTFASNEGYNPFLLYSNKSFLQKSTWIPYEGEIRNYMNVSNKRLNKRVKEVNEYVQTNIQNIGLEHISDAEALTKSDNTRVFALPYPFDRIQNETLQRCVEHNETGIVNDKTFVQIGLNSQFLNKHAMLINALKRMSDRDNAIVFLPFCAALPNIRCGSGTKVYKAQLRSTLASFDCKCIYKNTRLDPNDYIKYLDRMDIVLLNNNVCCQMHSLLSLLALNKRVFMNENSPLFNYLNEQGANIYSLNQFKEIGSLAEAKELQPSKIPDTLKNYYSEENAFKLWKQWLNSINN